jgi:hypothetical protein
MKSPSQLATSVGQAMFASVSTRCAVLVALLGILPPSVYAQDETFWSFLSPGAVVARCSEASDSHRRASERLQRLDEEIDGLKRTDSPAKVVTELHALLKTECFLPAAETDRVPRPDTVLSLKEWWSEAGGRDWLESFLQLPELGDVAKPKPHIVVPPDVRRTLDLESHADHPLRRFLCSLPDTACGANTRGWRLRAEASFEAHQALAQAAGSLPDEERPASGLPVISRTCAQTASQRPARNQYQAWRACVEEHRPTRVTLPLGDLRAPEDGWLVVSGRRGHYEFCDSTRAYDLETGAAFLADSCSRLALNRDGSVDREATNNSRTLRAAVGRVPVQNLQEALWMMLFRSEAQSLQVHAAYFPLPTGLVPRFSVRPPPTEMTFSSGPLFSTAQTVLAWQWIPTNGPAIAGEFAWPYSYDAAEDHAVSLLTIAENGFVDGCAPRRPPAVSLLRSSAPVRLNDASDDMLTDLVTDYSRAVEQWADLRPCEPKRH